VDEWDESRLCNEVLEFLIFLSTGLQRSRGEEIT
jgi:hypothetical protein